MADAIADWNVVAHAAKIAIAAHDGMFRKITGRPYIVHPGNVSATCMRHDLGPLAAAVSWLHDVREDCAPRWMAIIRASMPPLVTSTVDELTNPSHAPEHKQKPRPDRKAIDRAHLAQVSWLAKCVKLADRIDNLWDFIGCMPGQSFLRIYTDETYELARVLEGTHRGLEAELQAAITRARATITTGNTP